MVFRSAARVGINRQAYSVETSCEQTIELFMLHLLAQQQHGTGESINTDFLTIQHDEASRDFSQNFIRLWMWVWLTRRNRRPQLARELNAKKFFSLLFHILFIYCCGSLPPFHLLLNSRQIDEHRHLGWRRNMDAVLQIVQLCLKLDIQLTDNENKKFLDLLLNRKSRAEDSGKKKKKPSTKITTPKYQFKF